MWEIQKELRPGSRDTSNLGSWLLKAFDLCKIKSKLNGRDRLWNLPGGLHCPGSNVPIVVHSCNHSAC